MKAQVNVISGGPAGTVHVFSKNVVSIGRHPECDLQFDPQDDLQVSIRHAELVRSGDKWSVRDLQSSNGTFVNGHQISAETRLDTTDQIRFGRNGPLLEFKLVSDGTADTDKSGVTAKKEGGYGDRAPRTTDTGQRPPINVSRGDKSSTAERVAVEVRKQTRKLRTGLFTLAFVLVGVLGAATYVTRAQEQVRQEQLASLRAVYDSIVNATSVTIRELRGEVDGLADALQASRVQMRDLNSELERAEAEGNADLVASLTSQLAAARTQLNEQNSAAQMDHVAINRMNGGAVAMVIVEYSDGTRAGGTAFGVNANGTMVTNHHVVAGPDLDLRPRRIAVQFANSDQFFPAELVRASPDASIDLAVIRARVGSAIPVVAGLNRRPDTIPVGAPAATIGFPHGTDLPMAQGDRGRPLASATYTAALLTKNIPHDIQLQGFGAPGASGSPIFDANGEVIGVEYGGTPDAELIVGVRVDALIQLLGGN